MFGGQMEDPRRIITGTDELLEAYKSELSIGEENEALSLGTNITQIWKKLGDGFVKANWDNTIDEENKKMGIEIIVRDNQGEILI